jgi:glyoxylase-like metal-dependent hydrolase (beta-lactamase superfamily II)
MRLSLCLMALALPLCLAPLSACTPTPKLVVTGVRPAALGELTSGTDEITVHQIELRWSNAFVVKSGRGAILVDAGSPSDIRRLPGALRKLGMSPRDLKLVVLTHVHADHAGLAAELQKAGVKVVVGRGDEGVAKQGKNNPLKPQYTSAKLIRPLIDFPFKPFTPDRIIDGELDLEPFGLAGCRVVPMPGHTPGSVVVLIGQSLALSGDQFLGGYLGGAFLASQAGEHYYQDDPARNRKNIESMLERGVRRFMVGHGGPVEASSVREAFPSTPQKPKEE